MSSLQLERKLKAHNDAADTGNPMHDDEAARAMGFPGAVVPGVTVYGYITHTFVECFGNEWLTQGYCQVRFRQPVIADEEILLRASTDEADGLLHVSVENSAGVTTALAKGALKATEAFDTDGVLTNKNPPPQRVHAGGKWPAEAQTFEKEQVLRSFQTEIDTDAHEQFRREMRDGHAVYADAVHPSWLLRQANIIVDNNLKLGAWIHTESDIAHLGLAPINEPLEVRAETVRLFERKNNEYVDLDVQILINGDPARPVMRILHRAIYQTPLGERI